MTMSKILNIFKLDYKYNIPNYFYLIIILILGFFTVSIFYDIFQIHIYRHDSLYCMTQDNYLQKVSSEGRWLNYLLFPFLKSIYGGFWSVFVLISFSYFIFVASYRWTSNKLYSIIIALLFLQIPSFFDLITWPATTAPAFFILLLSVYVANRLPVYIFYSLFGILFFATMSNYYYLLPLLHLGILSKGNMKEQSKTFFLKILPAWAIGFVVGYAFTQLVVYIWFGHLIEIASWRNPHYIHSIPDLTHNFQLSFHEFQWHIKDIFSNYFLLVFGILSFIISFLGRKKETILYSTAIFIAIIIVHYIVVMPMGIAIAPRTIVATWVGVFAILFFIPSINPWKILILSPIIVLFAYNLYIRNHHNLEWYATVTNTDYKMLKKVSANYPKTCKGVIVLSDNSEMHKKNQLISKYYNLTRDKYIEELGASFRWSPIAKEVGFKIVGNCSHSNMSSLCKEIRTNIPIEKILQNDTADFFSVIGEYKKFLILSFDNKKLIKELEK